jgi:hypothetical protein
MRTATRTRLEKRAAGVDDMSMVVGRSSLSASSVCDQLSFSVLHTVVKHMAPAREGGIGSLFVSINEMRLGRHKNRGLLVSNSAYCCGILKAHLNT